MKHVRGVQWTIAGDTDKALEYEPDVYSYIFRLEVQNTNKLNQVWGSIELPENAFAKVSIQYGKRYAYIYVPYEKIEVPEEIPEIEKEDWEFIPGIAVMPGDDIEESIWPDMYDATGSMIVCFTPYWNSRYCQIDDGQYSRYEGDKFEDNIGFFVFACVERGTVIRWYPSAPYTLYNSDTYTNDWVPIPWIPDEGGLSLLDDYILSYIKTYGTITVYALGVPIECAETQAYFDSWRAGNIPGPGFTACSDVYVIEDGYETDNDGDGCPNSVTGNTMFFCSTYCGAINVYGKIWAARVKESYNLAGCWYYMGFCIGCVTTDCDTDIDILFSDTLGTPQSRTRVQINNRDYWIQTSPTSPPYWSYGQVVDDFDFKWNTTKTATASVIDNPSEPDGCSVQQVQDTITDCRRPTFDGWKGAYVPDACPKESLHGKYFIMYSEHIIDYHSHGIDDDDWGVVNAYYDAVGVYHQGTINFLATFHLYPYTVEEEIYDILCADINGVRVEIDRGTQEYEWFYVSDSHIYDFFGVPIYMFAYVKYGLTEPDGWDYKAIYTRYGYFYGGPENMRLSQIFYPAGTYGEEGYEEWCDYPHHDVFDSIKEGLYGWGQCSGFIRHRKTKEVHQL